MTIDKVDIEILRILQQDSSKPFVDIAEELSVTDGTIHQRVKKLKKSGTIKGFSIVIDHEKMGWDSLAYVLITVNPGSLELILKVLVKIHNVLEVYEVHTQGDLLIKLRARSQEEIRNVIVDKIRKIEGVTNTEVLTVYKCWKEDSNLPINSNLVDML
ncbi:MAG: Lrp/AsnC family transcriptional regulator [Candidatus Bathyarchaeota archaeon]|nr:Lrp/AsnC family transcriptional regulator [Candidatus Bathyarchaeota archaeon]